jgi:hypothetical protein
MSKSSGSADLGHGCRHKISGLHPTVIGDIDVCRNSLTAVAIRGEGHRNVTEAEKDPSMAAAKKVGVS